MDDSAKACVFLPGSECLYIRLYTSCNDIDCLLREIVAPLIQTLNRTHILKNWFFIRYSDPTWHLRLRFFGAADLLIKEVFQPLALACNRAFQAKHIYKVELGTYVREVERYGGMKALQIAETLFTIDSEAVLALLKLMPSNEHLSDRWKIAVAGTDRLLDDFGLTVRQKLDLVSKLYLAFEAEFVVDHKFKDSVARRFRIERSELVRLISRDRELSVLQTRAMQILAHRSERNRSVFKDYRLALVENNPDKGVNDVVGSFVHMHVNRLLRSTHRAQEVVIYNFLAKLYSSLIAQQSSQCD